MKIKINHHRTITKWTLSGADLYDTLAMPFISLPSVTLYNKTYTETVYANYKVMPCTSGWLSDEQVLLYIYAKISKINLYKHLFSFD